MIQTKMLVFSIGKISHMIPLHTIIDVKMHADAPQMIDIMATGGSFKVACSFKDFRSKVTALLNDTRNIIVLDEEEKKPELKTGPIIPMQEPNVGM